MTEIHIKWLVLKGSSMSWGTKRF